MNLVEIFTRIVGEPRSNELVSHLGTAGAKCLAVGGALTAMFSGVAALPLLLPFAVGMAAGLAGIKLAYGSYSLARYG